MLVPIRVPKLEPIMRFTSVAIAATLALVSISTSLSAQRPDDQIDARSVALLQQAKAARASGDLDAATDLLETAVAVDPRNRQAFVVLAEVAETRGLPGKAIRLYREALLLEPNDVTALAGQGEPLSLPFGRPHGHGLRLTPAHDGTDGFFVARLRAPC